MHLSTAEVIVILGVLVLLFGVGRITKVGGELGSGIRAFKEGLSGKKDGGADKKDETDQG